MTTIFDTVQLPDGTPAAGAHVSLELIAETDGHGGEGFVTGDQQTVLGIAHTKADATGHWTFADVTPNDAITPDGTAYRVTVTSRFTTECYYVAVPTSAQPVWAGDALTVAPTPLPAPITGLGYITPVMTRGDLQAALNADVDTVFLPAGSYPAGAYTVTGPKNIVGAGAFATRMTGVFTVTGDDVTITGIGFDGTGHAPVAAIAAVDVHRLRVIDCSFMAMAGNAVELTRIAGVWVRNCDFLTCQLSGVRLNDPAPGTNTDVWIEGNRLYSCQAGKVTGNAAIQLAGGVAANTRVFIDSNLIVGPGVVGIGADSLDGGTIINNRMFGEGATGEGIALMGSNLYVAGNSVTQFSAAGILWYCSNARTPNRRCTIVGNDISDCLAQGIAIDFASSNTDIQDLSVLSNRVARNLIAIQSYAGAAGLTGLSWSHVYMLSNTLVDSTSAEDFSLLMPEAVVMDNLTDAGPGTTNGIYGRRAASMIGVGAPGAASTLEAVHALHNGDTGSVSRIAAGFSILPNQAIAGFEAEKMDQFANHVRLHLFTSGGQVPQRLLTIDPGNPSMVWWRGNFHLMEAITPPGAQGANRGVVYVDVNAGKTRLMCQFPTGAPVPVAVEP